MSDATPTQGAEPFGARRLMGLESGPDGGRFDGHMHLFTRAVPMIAEREYTPEADATLERFEPLLRDNGLDGALVVQPSILGFDNSHLLDRIAAGNRIEGLAFRGVAAVAPGTPHDEMARLAAGGIVGLRINFIGVAEAPDLTAPGWRSLMQAVGDLGWYVEIHQHGRHLPALLPQLRDACDFYVVDHFGRPDPALGIDDPGFRALLDAAGDAGALVKVSAPYRIWSDLPPDDAAARAAPLYRALADAYGPERLVWASDWPWTRFEDRMTYTQTCAWRDLWRWA